MAVIDATVGGANANSYATVVEGTAYAEERPNSAAWTDATSAQQIAALITACRILDSRITWHNAPTEIEVQALQWPRVGMINARGDMLEDDVVPKEVKWAQIEVAIGLLQRDVLGVNSAEAEGIKKLAAGSVSMEFVQGSGKNDRLVLSSMALDFIRPFIHEVRTGGSIPLQR